MQEQNNDNRCTTTIKELCPFFLEHLCLDHAPHLSCTGGTSHQVEIMARICAKPNKTVGTSVDVPSYILVAKEPKERLTMPLMSPPSQPRLCTIPPQASPLSDSSDIEEGDAEEEEQSLVAESVSTTANRSTSNYELERYEFRERLAFYTPENVFHPKYNKAIQACCIFEAGTRVYATATKKDPDLRDMFLETYETVIAELDDTYIDDLNKERLKILAGGRQDNSSVPMDGEKILKKFSDFRRELNKHFFSTGRLPKDVATMKSGQGLTDAYEELKNKLIDEFWDPKKAKKNQGTDPPENWIYKGTGPSFLFLCAQVFRKSIHLNPKTSNMNYGNTGKSKAEAKRERDAKRKAAVEAKNDDGKRRAETNIENKTKKANSKVTSANAYEQSVAVKARQAETDEIKTSLELLSKYGTDFTEDEVACMRRKALMRLFGRKTMEETLKDVTNHHSPLEEADNVEED